MSALRFIPLFLSAVILAFVGCTRDSTPPKAEVGEKKKEEAKAPDNRDKKEPAIDPFVDGDLAMMTGQLDKAIPAYSEAIRQNPKNVDAYTSRGLCYSSKGDQEKAFKDFDDAIRLAPKNSKAYKYRGTIYSAKAEFDLAIADFEQAIQFDKSDQDALKLKEQAQAKKNALADKSLNTQEPLTINAHAKWVSSIVFYADGKLLASAGKLEKHIKLWDLATGKEKTALKGHEFGIDSLAFRSEGNILASSSIDELKLWNLSTETEHGTLPGTGASIRPIAFSKDGKLLASVGKGGSIELFDVGTKKEKITLKGHRINVNCLAFSPDGTLLASGGFSDGVKLWNVITGDEDKAITKYVKGLARPVTLGPVRSVAFHPTEKMLVTAIADRVTLWDLPTGEEQFTFKGHSSVVLSVAFSPDGRRVISGAGDKTVRLWDVETKTAVTTFTGYSDHVTCVAYSQDGNKVAAGTMDGTIKIYVVGKGSFAAPPVKPVNSKQHRSEKMTGDELIEACKKMLKRPEHAKINVPQQLLEKDPHLVYLCLGSESMKTSERQKWFDDYAKMKAQDVEQLRSILLDETRAFEEITARQVFGTAQSLIDKNEYAEAIPFLTLALSLSYREEECYRLRGFVYSTQKEYKLAVFDYTKAIEISPKPEVYRYRGHQFGNLKDYKPQFLDYAKSLELAPKDPNAMNSVAWFLAACPDAAFRNGKKAIDHATKACELTQWKNPLFMDTLAAAYAEVGEFKEATQWQEKSLGDPTLAKMLSESGLKDAGARLELYKKGKPYHGQ